MRLKINGKNRTVKCPLDKRLLDLLREDLRLTGTKEGCGEGECGACSVVLNGEAVNSCLILVGQLNDGDEILTVEGLEKTPLGKKIQKSFMKAGAVQCGFCTPGMLMAAYALLKKNKKPKKSEIEDGIAGNLCRCTGYKKIVEAIAMCTK